jgi:2-dehydropantoate 2-reductase
MSTEVRVRILVFGAGVIGCVYAARLQDAGHEVTLVARGAGLDRLAGGITTVTAGRRSTRAVRLVPSVGPERHDLLVVAVRRDQLGAALPELAAVDATTVLLLQNLADPDEVAVALGRDRVVVGFPGVGGYVAPDGAIHYLEIAQQPTTLGRNGGVEVGVREVLEAAGFAVAVTGQMPGWLRTHAVFVVALGAALDACGGDVDRLAGDRRLVRSLVSAVREGFAALAATGVDVTPTGLRVIFTVVPRWLAVRYWQRQLRGELGSVSLAPHLRRTAGTELVALAADVRESLRTGPPTPVLDALLAPCSWAARAPRPETGGSRTPGAAG